MADVTLPWAAEKVVVDLDTCVKTGRPTNETVTLRGTTTPLWITVLLVFSVFGYLLATMLTMRRYELKVPFTHAAYDHWNRRRWAAWAAGLTGGGFLAGAVAANDGRSGVLAGVGLVILTGAVVFGVANSLRNSVGVHVNRDQDLVIVRTHPSFADAVRAAAVEPLARA
ncbi:hypothetical protein [Nocardioides jishulii]|uniref:Uncharacterized protein n=1 Tax=Nocardioides jishulii TaxID=2575440 RepID=A0A4U2YHF4_9ACTN|nr:hypothetical protein [Nocardioides jishulii]QCX26612.1 hypothetical protein FCL41_02910 [Nocardioides jishulii]TKI60419.1 hypothetical protein FC770_16640 [Nocardioides jishulii]